MFILFLLEGQCAPHKNCISNEHNDDGDDSDNSDFEENEKHTNSDNDLVEIVNKLDEEEKNVERNLNLMHLEELTEESNAMNNISVSNSEERIKAARVSVHDLALRSQLRSQHYANESERLVKLKAQVEARRRETAHRKLEAIEKLSKRYEKQEKEYRSTFNNAKSNNLVIKGNKSNDEANARMIHSVNHTRVQNR